MARYRRVAEQGEAMTFFSVRQSSVEVSPGRSSVPSHNEDAMLERRGLLPRWRVVARVEAWLVPARPRTERSAPVVKSQAARLGSRATRLRAKRPPCSLAAPRQLGNYPRHGAS